MNQLEYVASGPNYMKVSPLSMKDNDTFDFFIRNIEQMNRKIDHKFSFLYNAYTEKDHGPLMVQLKEKGAIHNIYGDSGGLQAVTRGLDITDKFKLRVYENQSLYCDKAMSFDEIPVKTLKAKSKKTDVHTRLFDINLLEPCARKSGRNLKEQIEMFVKDKTTAQPILIIQGNCYDSYMKWTEYAISEIPKELREYIGGVAISDTASGIGVLQDIKRAFYYTCLPWRPKNNHSHLLGVGSIIRMLPIVMFFQNGLYEDVWVSYDSTSHSSGVIQGRYFFPGGGMSKLGLRKNHLYDKLYKDMHTKFEGLELSEDELHSALAGSSKKNDYNGLTQTRSFQIQSLFGLTNIYNFIEHLETLTKSKENLLHFLRKKNKMQYQSLKNLYSVTDKESFEYWEKHCKHGLSSKLVDPSASASLEEFI